MKLKTKVISLKKGSLGTYDYSRVESNHYIIYSIEVILSNKCSFIVRLQRHIGFHKFRCTAERIVREINKNISEVAFYNPQYMDVDHEVWMTSTEDDTCTFYLESPDLDKIKFSREHMKIVRKELEERYTYTKNPSKPKSDMEYRKRAYNGKCKRK